MAVKFRKKAIKFLEKANPEEVENIREQLNQMFVALNEQGIIPFTELDIKKMKGDWEGFYRLRIGKIRIIFTVDINSREIEVYMIGVRGDVYKK
jgi:mRNA interferase RelE/StbE